VAALDQLGHSPGRRKPALHRLSDASVKRVPEFLLGSARFGKTCATAGEERHDSRTADHFYDMPSFSSIVERNPKTLRREDLLLRRPISPSDLAFLAQVNFFRFSASVGTPAFAPSGRSTWLGRELIRGVPMQGEKAGPRT
jgi:hypothetical protein